MDNNSNTKKKRLTLWLDPQVITKAKTLALSYGISVSHFVKGLIETTGTFPQKEEEQK